MKIMYSSNNIVRQSTILAVRYRNQVDTYNVSDWSPRNSFTGLSCGEAKDQPSSGLEIDPTNTWFLTSGEDAVGVYDLNTGVEEFLWETGNELTTPSISKNGEFIAFGDVRKIYVFETSTWTKEAEFDPDTLHVGFVLSWSYDGTKLAVGDENGYLVIYNTVDWTVYAAAIDLSDDIYAINFSPDDTEIAVSLDSAGATHVLNVMTVASTLITGSAMADNLLGTDSFDNCFNSDNTLIYGSCSLTATGAIESFETTATWPSDTQNPLALTNYPLALALSSDDSLLAVGENGSLQILNADDLTVVSGTPTLAESIYGVAFDHK